MPPIELDLQPVTDPASMESLPGPDAADSPKPSESKPGIEVDLQPVLIGTGEARGLAAEYPGAITPPAYVDPEERQKEDVGQLFSDPEGWRQRKHEEYLQGFGDGTAPVKFEESTDVDRLRAKVGFLQSPEDKLKVLQRELPDRQPRLAKDGETIMLLEGADGGEKAWKFLDLPTLTAKDFYADNPSEMLPMVGAMVGAGVGATVGTAEPGGGNIIGAAGGAAAGHFLVGSAQDAAARAMMGIDVRPGEIAARRGVEAAMGIPIDFTTGLIGRYTTNPYRALVPKASDPARREALRFQEAIDVAKDRFGVDIVPTGGQLANSPRLMAFENFTRLQPGGGRLSARQRKSMAKIGDLQKRILGPETDPYTTGKVLADGLQQMRDDAAKSASSAVADAGELATKAIKQDVGVVNFKDIDTHQIGASFEGFKDRAFADVKARVDKAYARVDALEPSGGVVDLSGLAKLKSKIEAELPKASRQGNGGVEVFPAGETRQGTTARLLDQIPEWGVLSNGKRKWTISEARKMRTALGNLQNFGHIVSGEGFDNKLVSEIRKGVDDAIEDAVKKGPPEFQQALSAANQLYKTERVPFDEPGIRELFAAPNEPGLRGAAILDRFLVGNDGGTLNAYRQMQRVFGNASPEGEEILRQSVLQMAARKAGLDAFGAEQVVDPAKFMEVIGRVHPEIRESLFRSGSGAAKKQSIDTTIKQLNELGQKRIRVDEVVRLTQQGTPIHDAMMKAAKSQQLLDGLEANRIVKAMTTGGTDSMAVEPARFVEVVLDQAATNRDLDEALKALGNTSPQFIQDARFHFLRKVMTDASTTPSKASGANAAVFDEQKFNKILRDPITRKKLEYFFDPDDMLALNALGTITTQVAKKGALDDFGASLAQASIFGRLIRATPQVMNAVKSFMWAIAIDSPAARALVRRGVKGAELSPMDLAGILGSRRALGLAIETFGEAAPELDEYVQLVEALAQEGRTEDSDSSAPVRQGE